jgi:hypothetical protein
MQNYQRAWHDISERGGKTLACDLSAQPQANTAPHYHADNTLHGRCCRGLYTGFTTSESAVSLSLRPAARRPSKSRCRPHFSLFSLDVALSPLYAQCACIGQAFLQVYPRCNLLAACSFTLFLPHTYAMASDASTITYDATISGPIVATIDLEPVSLARNAVCSATTSQAITTEYVTASAVTYEERVISSRQRQRSSAGGLALFYPCFILLSACVLIIAAIASVIAAEAAVRGMNMPAQPLLHVLL